jgi:exonuclease III
MPPLKEKTRPRWPASPKQVAASQSPSLDTPSITVKDSMYPAAEFQDPISPATLRYFTKIPQLTFSAQNCNSLNISTECDKQLSKLIAITALRTDIIFLSDIRLNLGIAQIEKIRKIFACNSNKNYDFFYNSTTSRRGVGILISKSLDFCIEGTYTDKTENILGLLTVVNGIKIKFCSVYGPNHNDKTFYSNLDSFLSTDPLSATIIGGDWNTTYSTFDTASNPDIINMSNPPSITRSGWLSDLCKAHDLVDPFRALHPTRRDFTYAPPGQKKNRSRLDFFLINSSLLSNLKDCEISHSLSCSSFDHKPISLDFTRNKTKPKPYINRTITDNPRTVDVVLAAFADTYLAHAAPHQPAEDEDHVFRAAHVDILTSQKVIVARLMQLLRDHNDLLERKEIEHDTDLLTLLIAEKETEIVMQKELLWDVPRYQGLVLTCPADYFLEALMSSIKGAVISFQAWVKKTDNLKKSLLIKKINSLRQDFAANHEEITSAEAKLNSILDSELMAKVKSMKLFNCLNSEKPTPIFLNLARTSNSGKTLSVINKPDGSNYANDTDRNEGIVSFYEDIYRKPSDEPSDLLNCVEKFLGTSIVDHPIVNNSKLSDEEIISLERPLTVDELDLSVEKCNLRSAPGIDGVNNYFIKKFWHLLRIPLLNYSASRREGLRPTFGLLQLS